MGKLVTLIDQITNVGELVEALKTLPEDTVINPFGSSISKLAYDKENNIAYIDESDFLDSIDKEE